MQTYFADLLAFFGISGAPQTFAELRNDNRTTTKRKALHQR